MTRKLRRRMLKKQLGTNKIQSAWASIQERKFGYYQHLKLKKLGRSSK